MLHLKKLQKLTASKQYSQKLKMKIQADSTKSIPPDKSMTPANSHEKKIKDLNAAGSIKITVRLSLVK